MQDNAVPPTQNRPPAILRGQRQAHGQLRRGDLAHQIAASLGQTPGDQQTALIATKHDRLIKSGGLLQSHIKTAHDLRATAGQGRAIRGMGRIDPVQIIKHPRRQASFSQQDAGTFATRHRQLRCRLVQIGNGIGDHEFNFGQARASLLMQLRARARPEQTHRQAHHHNTGQDPCDQATQARHTRHGFTGPVGAQTGTHGQLWREAKSEPEK